MRSFVLILIVSIGMDFGVFFCFHLLGLKMTEVKHWGVKLGLKLSVVGLLLLFR